MRKTAAGRPSSPSDRSPASFRMAPKHHPTPLSGGDRKALKKELGKARAMTGILAAQSDELRAKGDALIRQADRLLAESWNERMWADGEPIDPSPTVDQAINGGYPWLQIECSRCKAPNQVDLAVLPLHRQLSFMISPAGCAVKNALRRAGAPRRRCCN